MASNNLCSLCQKFISDLFEFNFTKQDPWPSPWVPHPDSSTGYVQFGPGFKHHSDIASLALSAQNCRLCNMLHETHSSLGEDKCRGWLGLYPWWDASRIGVNGRRGHFRSGFRDSLGDMPYDNSLTGSLPVDCFKICRWPPPENIEDGLDWSDQYKSLMAAPTHLSTSYVAQKVKSWMSRCRDRHETCKDISTGPLPTRVIDLGLLDTDTPRLYESQGKEHYPYAALSHCWGGDIPASTIQSSLSSRLTSIIVSDLPQNFIDAFQVTKALGIRYLWIDSLCIIQDDKDDWAQQSAQMATFYGGATLVLSILDAAASTDGFLDSTRNLMAVIDDTYAVQKAMPRATEYFQTCPLNSRAWCLQERLLAPRVLHFGKDVMFYECPSDLHTEDGQSVQPIASNAAAVLINLKKRLGDRRTTREFRDWYELLEEYTARRLTVSADKLPALAGAATLFAPLLGPATSVAGLWAEDAARGCLWGAHYDHAPMRRVWGYASSDTCVTLTRPATSTGSPRAPSWSWASVDGQVDFWALRIGDDKTKMKVLDVSPFEPSTGSKAHSGGRMKVNASVASMFYVPGVGDVGRVAFQEPAKNLSEKQLEKLERMKELWTGCIMDMNRQTRRACYGLIAAGDEKDSYLLMLEKCKDGTYKRIGMCTAYDVGGKVSKKFTTQDIVLV